MENIQLDVESSIFLMKIVENPKDINAVIKEYPLSQREKLSLLMSKLRDNLLKVTDDKY